MRQLRRELLLERVDLGIEYLDETYGEWWLRVAVREIRFGLKGGSILAKVQNTILQLTSEWADKDEDWFLQRAFIKGRTSFTYSELDTCWRERVAQIQKERR